MKFKRFRDSVDLISMPSYGTRRMFEMGLYIALIIESIASIKSKIQVKLKLFWKKR